MEGEPDLTRLGTAEWTTIAEQLTETRTASAAHAKAVSLDLLSDFSSDWPEKRRPAQKPLSAPRGV